VLLGRCARARNETRGLIRRGCWLALHRSTSASIDESAPLPKFSTDTDKRYAVADLAALVTVGALTPDAELEAYLRAEGDLPELPEDEEQKDDGDEEQPTPIRPAARKRMVEDND
jgi:hypothetical protein